MPRTSHRERIYELLLCRIRAGAISWGDRLVDVALANEMGVSRMPVREALMRLTAEGYLTSTTRGFTLPRLSQKEVLEVFELRRLLEPRAAALAAQNMDEETLAVMSDAVAQAETALAVLDVSTLFRVSEIFRDGWLRVVPHSTLRQTIRRYLVQVQNVRIITMHEEETLKTIVAGQRDLLALHLVGDSVGASDRMLRYVIEGEQAFRAAIDILPPDNPAKPVQPN